MFQYTWSRIVEQYSSCALTKKTDKLIAIEGLAKQLQMRQNRTDSTNTYNHGLWDRNLHLQLCWKHYDELKPEQLKSSIAPTWSWANLDGKVSYDVGYDFRTTEYSVSWIHVENSDITSASNGILTLKGIAVFGTLPEHFGQYIDTVSLPHVLVTPGVAPLNSLERIKFDLDISRWPTDSFNIETVCFFMVRISFLVDKIYGLVLWQKPKSTEYVRLGTFTLDARCRQSDKAERTDFMKHIAARQGLLSCIEGLPEEYSDGYVEALYQRAEKGRWEMDLDRMDDRSLAPGCHADMTDLLYTVRTK